MVLVTELENNLWGAVLNGKTHFEHKSDRSVHISMASLDTSAKNDQFVPVKVNRGSDSFILCTLHQPSILQQTLNLELNKGETVSFHVDATHGVVHLTGYYIPDAEDLDDEARREEFMQLLGNGGHTHGGQPCNGDHGDDDDDEFDEDESDLDDDDDDDEDEDDEEKVDEPRGKKRKLNEIKKAEPEDDDNDDDDDDDEEDDDEEDDDEEDDDEDDEPPQLVEPPQDKKKALTAGNGNKQETTNAKTVDGVQIKENKLGHGIEAKKGKSVCVYYTGKLKQNGKTFDSCTSGKPFKFRLGAGEVIKGWDIGVNGMKVGGKRTLTIPPHLAYGSKKMGNDIPANSTLVFDVELKSVS